MDILKKKISAEIFDSHRGVSFEIYTVLRLDGRWSPVAFVLRPNEMGVEVKVLGSLLSRRDAIEAATKASIKYIDEHLIEV